MPGFAFFFMVTDAFSSTRQFLGLSAARAPQPADLARLLSSACFLSWTNCWVWRFFVLGLLPLLPPAMRQFTSLVGRTLMARLLPEAPANACRSNSTLWPSARRS